MVPPRASSTHSEVPVYLSPLAPNLHSTASSLSYMTTSPSGRTLSDTGLVMSKCVLDDHTGTSLPPVPVSIRYSTRFPSGCRENLVLFVSEYIIWPFNIVPPGGMYACGAVVWQKSFVSVKPQPLWQARIKAGAWLMAQLYRESLLNEMPLPSTVHEPGKFHPQ